MGPNDFRVDGHPFRLQLVDPRIVFFFAHGEGHMARPLRAVQGNGHTVNLRHFRSSCLGVEQQEHAVPAAEEDVPRRILD